MTNTQIQEKIDSLLESAGYPVFSDNIYITGEVDNGKLIIMAEGFDTTQEEIAFLKSIGMPQSVEIE